MADPKHHQGHSDHPKEHKDHHKDKDHHKEKDHHKDTKEQKHHNKDSREHQHGQREPVQREDRGISFNLTQRNDSTSSNRGTRGDLTLLPGALIQQVERSACLSPDVPASLSSAIRTQSPCASSGSRRGSSVIRAEREGPLPVAVLRKDPLDLCNEVIATLRRHGTLVRKIQGTAIGEYRRGEFLEMTSKSGKILKQRFFNVWRNLQALSREKSGRLCNMDHKPKTHTPSESPLSLPRRSYIKASEQDSPRTLVRYSPDDATDQVWKAKADSCNSLIENVDRLERYRGILGKIMVPDYTKDDIASDLILRPSRFPRAPAPTVATFDGSASKIGGHPRVQPVPAWF